MLIAGCIVGPDFVKPDPNLPEVSFQGDNGSDVADARHPAPTDPTWWRVFRDPILTDLEQQVAAANLDVQTATRPAGREPFSARRRPPRACFRRSTATPSNQRELYSQNGIISLIAPLAAATVPAIRAINDYNTGFDASWELDLWGKVRRQVEAADAKVDQAADQRRDAMVSSLAELARDYIQLRGVQTQIRIANENLKVDRDILDLAQQRQQRGAAKRP